MVNRIELRHRETMHNYIFDTQKRDVCSNHVLIDQRKQNRRKAVLCCVWFMITKIFLLLFSAFCFLQIRGVKNWFTEFGHVWNRPQYEKHGMVVYASLGSLLLWLALH